MNSEKHTTLKNIDSNSILCINEQISKISSNDITELLTTFLSITNRVENLAPEHKVELLSAIGKNLSPDKKIRFEMLGKLIK
ncbi:MAG: hypothetical protein BEN19_08615 [Epulopiscium sp. Nuni2H_MBin003]|nr:MAG: hypothetical protein BEN19_08615 [Epulopiscium sp. Nuni2H_MBin003]